MALPPGVTQANFDRALRDFEKAVGSQWVFTSDDDVALYRDAYSPFQGEPEERTASAAVAPHTVEEVQAVVRAANNYRIPIYPISTGKNLGYGGSAPNLSGSVVLDLKRMNRILEVNEKNASALVEPGVSYFDLYRYIQEHKLKVWIDCPDPGWGSLVGNALDHGGGYTHDAVPQSLRCALRHGSGARERRADAHRHGRAAGREDLAAVQVRLRARWIDGMFSQSNFGVVTKMGFWLMPQPDAYLTGTVSVPKHEDLIPLVDILNFLENSGVVNGMPQLGSPLLGGFFSPDRQRAARSCSSRNASTDELEAYRAASRVAATGAAPSSSTDRPRPSQANWEYCQEKFSAIPGAKFENGETYKFPLSAAEIEDITRNQAAGSRSATLPEFGIPSLTMFSIGARSRDESEPRQRPHVVLADHPALGRGDLRGATACSPRRAKSSTCR